MSNFDLKKYLANNPLLENKLSPQEQDIVDDILSVSEGIGEIMNKIKSYAKKGLLTAAIITALVSQLNAQGQTQLANQIQKQATELVITPAKKSSKQIIWEKPAVGMEISYDSGMYNLISPSTTYRTINILDPTTGRPFGYQVVSSGGGTFKNKENIIKAFEAGLKMLNMETPQPGQYHTAEIDGVKISRGYVRPNTFNINGAIFNERFANQIINALESFNP